MKKIIGLMALVLTSSLSFGASLPAATITEYVSYADTDGRMIFKTDMPESDYAGASWPLGWFQLEGDTPKQVIATLLLAYSTGAQVSLAIDDNVCSTGSWPKITAVKIIN